MDVFADGPPELIGLVVGLAFLPPLFWTMFVRNVEHWNREPLGAVLKAFLYGAIVSVFFALLLSYAASQSFVREYELPAGVIVPTTVILVLIVAPLAEEFSKALGVRTVRRRITEPEDGIVYGVAAGLGFSATENLFYELAALSEDGGYSFVAVAALRSFSSSFLHATATGILGYGMARRYLTGMPLIALVPYYAGAVLLHSGFNALAMLQVENMPIAGLLLVLFVAGVCMRWTIQRIRSLDRGAVAYR